MGCSVVLVASCIPPQIIDTVPMDETTEEMFGYFEPLYEVIHDMPRPPEAFFKRKGGEWEPPALCLCPAHPSPLCHTPLLTHHSCCSLLASALVWPSPLGSALPQGCCLRGGQDGHTTSHLVPLLWCSC